MCLLMQDIHSTSTVSIQQEQARRLKSCTQNAAIGDRLGFAWYHHVIQASCKCDNEKCHRSASQSGQIWRAS